jgi:hypothetical protein
MKLIKPPREYAEAGLSAMKMVASAKGGISPAAQNLLAAAQRHLLDTRIDIAALAPIAPEALGEVIRDPALRRQFIQGMVVMSLADGVPSKEQAATVESFARAVDIDAAEVHSLRRLADQRMLLFRLDFLRRSHIADIVKHQLEDQGFQGLVKGLLGLRGYLEDPDLAARYRALARLPEDTLGHQFIRYLDRNKFAAPGERFGFPEAGIYHDFTHVLSGYDTDPQGEVQIAGFIAGYKKENPFFVILFVTLTFSAGVNVTPLPQPHSEGIFAQEGLADRFFTAIERGSRVNVDLSDRWNHWDYVDKPVDEVRQALNIGP